jgi:hypothetical protein
MHITSVLRNLALAAALVALTVPAFAKPVTTTLAISRNAHVGQAQLKSGDYHVKIDGNHLTIFDGNKVVAESEGRWEDRDSKAAYSSVVSDTTGSILELRFEGKKSVFVLAQ